MCSLSASAKPSASCACNSAMKCSCSLIDSSQRLASKLASDLARRILAVRAAQVVCSTGLPASRAISAWICWFMHGTVSGIAQRTGRAMSDDKPSPRRGRKPPPGDKRQFLTTMDPDVIRAIKQAALGLDRTASDVMEEAAKEWPERHRA